MRLATQDHARQVVRFDCDEGVGYPLDQPDAAHTYPDMPSFPEDAEPHLPGAEHQNVVETEAHLEQVEYLKFELFLV